MGWDRLTRCPLRVQASLVSQVIIIIIIHHHYDLDAFPSTCADVSIDAMTPSIHLSINPLTYFPLPIHPSIHPIIRVILRMRSCEPGELCSQQAVAAAPGTWPGDSP